jgi:hypothetical protein
MLPLPNNLLAVTLYDCTLGIWDLTTGEYRKLAGHYNSAGECYEPATDLKLSYDKKELISISDSGIKFWDIKTGDYRKELIVRGGNKVETLPNGYIAISGCSYLYNDRVLSDESNIEIWNPVTEQRITILKGYPDKYEKGIGCLQLINEGKWLASGCKDGSVKIWDITELTSNVAVKCIATIQTVCNYDSPWGIKQLRNGNLVIYLWENTVEWNVTSNECIVMDSVGSYVENLANGQLVAHNGSNDEINLLNEDFTLNKTLPYDRSNGDVRTFRLLDNGNLACEMSNNEIQILNLKKYALSSMPSTLRPYT